MSGEFRTLEEEVIKLLEECGELKHALKTISGQLSRMEKRAKVAFPSAAKIVDSRRASARKKTVSSLSSDEAMKRFQGIVDLASRGETAEAERLLEKQGAADLYVIAKEVGASFTSNKPSVRAMREAIFGKVRESILLTRHTPRS
jgi:hypothetical protein